MIEVKPIITSGEFNDIKREEKEQHQMLNDYFGENGK